MAIETQAFTVGTATPVPIDINGASQVTIYCTDNPVYLATRESNLVNHTAQEFFLLPINTVIKFDGSNRTFYAIASGGTAYVYTLAVL